MNMRQIRVSRTGFVVWWVLALSSCWAVGDPVLRVNATVHDRAGTPLGDVLVVLSAPNRGPHQTRSASDGSFDVSVVGATEGMLSASKPGYLPRSLAVKPRGGALKEVVLDRLAQPTLR
jgi:hypothetical protein